MSEGLGGGGVCVCVAEAVTGAPQHEGEKSRWASQDGHAFRWDSPCDSLVPSQECLRRCGRRLSLHPSLHPRAPGVGGVLLYLAPAPVLSFATWTGSSSARGIVTILRSSEASFLSSQPIPTPVPPLGVPTRAEDRACAPCSLVGPTLMAHPGLGLTHLGASAVPFPTRGSLDSTTPSGRPRARRTQFPQGGPSECSWLTQCMFAAVITAVSSLLTESHGDGNNKM